jgi:glycine/D-amino acid oxidase-like deaminating enzyme
MSQPAEVVICGAGVAGISAALHLSRQGIAHVVLVDERPPLTLTSDKSTEAYRNWWPGPDASMIQLMNRSITLIEELARECDNRYLLNRRGYVYASAREEAIAQFEQIAKIAAEQGAGPLRTHTGQADGYVKHHAEGFEQDQLDGADLLIGRDAVQKWFPYFTEETIAVLHTRKCGWFSGQQFGMVMLELAQQAGVKLISGKVTSVQTSGGRVEGVTIDTEGGTEKIATGRFVNAAGPMLREVGQLVGIDLPVFSELHVKASFKDHLGIIPRDAPMLIWEDDQILKWSDDEREMLAAEEEMRWMIDTLPAGVHTRPEGGAESQNILILWPYHAKPVPETFPITFDPDYPEVIMRGMSAMIPRLSEYLGKLPKPFLDGGYYTKTRENRLLAGPLPVEGAYVIGALSGYGLMACSAAGELLSLHISGGKLPDYAPRFVLSRYEDPDYLTMLDNWGSNGQL